MVADGIVSSFRHVWPDSWGPRLDYILTNAVRALLDAPGATLLMLPRLLIDEAFRTQLIQTHVTDPVVGSFWLNEYAGYSDNFRTEAIAPIQNKISKALMPGDDAGGFVNQDRVLKAEFPDAARNLVDLPFGMRSGVAWIDQQLVDSHRRAALHQRPPDSRVSAERNARPLWLLQSVGVDSRGPAHPIDEPQPQNQPSASDRCGMSQSPVS